MNIRIRANGITNTFLKDLFGFDNVIPEPGRVMRMEIIVEKVIILEVFGID